MLRLFAAAALFLFAGLAPAKNLYVNNSGTPACSDSTTYAANDASNPWCTVGRAAWGSTSYSSPSAAQAAAAGDTVLITAGTYTTAGNTSGSGCRWLVALNPANSGSSGSLITFQGQGTVNIRLASGSYGPTIGADGRNYIVWDNIHIDESAASGASCSDTGPVVVHDCTGCKVINSTIVGTYRAWGDNYVGIRFEAVNSGVGSHNTISDITCDFSSNCAGIMLYDVADSAFDHNHISASATGIYIKGDHVADGWPQENNDFRFNWLASNTTTGFKVVAGQTARLTQNVIEVAAGTYGLNYDGPSIDGFKFVNNTLINMSGTAASGVRVSSVASSITNFQFFNNIFYGTFGEAANLGEATSLAGMSWEHNVYYNYSVWGSYDGSQISLATWKATHSQDAASPAAITSNPDFVSTTYPGGYKLNTGSPSLTQGVDILDLDGDSSTTDTIPAGAYISGSETIGPGGTALLPGPSNVRWRPRPRKRRDPWNRRRGRL